MNGIPHRRAGRAGFTLVEILVAVAILSILVLMLGQMLTSAQQAIDVSTRHLTTDAQARLVFDRMGNDFSQMIQDDSVDHIFYKGGNGNDAMFFYSRSPGHIDDPADGVHETTSLIGYRINSNFQLERLGKSLNWDTAASGDTTPGGPVFLSYNYAGGTRTINPASTIAQNWADTVGTAGAGYTDGKDTDYHVLGDGVFRFSIGFLQTISVGNATGTPSYIYPAPNVPIDGSNPLDYVITKSDGTTTHYHVNAIVVALGILDSKSRELGAPTATTVGALADPTDPYTMLSSWTSTLQSADFATKAKLSPTAQVRVYQHTFYLNDSQFQP
jgi:prepilin-type N-terminal cleavage/methylation domain-containing protein